MSPRRSEPTAAVLEAIPAGGQMLELGAYWGFYSLWFAKSVPGARCVLVEPSRSNLEYGRENFKLNVCQAEFIQGFVGADAAASHDGVPEVTVDELCARRGIGRLHILHADMQGAEVQMLAGAHSVLSAQNADFVFISAHSEDLHRQ